MSASSAAESFDASGVTAVVVSHNGQEWIPALLRALSDLNPAPATVIAVDNGSGDDSLQLLETAVEDGVLGGVITGEPSWSYAQAVATALAGREPQWVWLLHDDCVPAPDCLGQLLEGAQQSEAAVVVPKLLQPPRRNYPDLLAEIGQSITNSGRRVLSVERGEIDQSQHHPEPVLGASTAGMLIKGEVWRDLGGLAVEVPLFRDGVEFGWRANQAGYSVSTWPAASIMHRQAGRMNERESQLFDSPHEMDRLSALRVVAARGGRARWLLILESVLRVLGFILAKSPRRASAEARALRRFATSGQLVDDLAARGTGSLDSSTLRPGRWRFISEAADWLGNWFAERYREIASNDGQASLDELTGDDFAGKDTRRYLISPILLMLVILGFSSLLAARSLVGTGELAGGGLLPAPIDVSTAWRAFLEPEVRQPGANAPWLGLAAILATLTFGHPDWVPMAGVVAGPALSAITAMQLLRHFHVPYGTTAAAAISWAGAALTLGVFTAGDVTGIVLAVLTPLFVRAIHRVIVSRAMGAEQLRAPAVASFWLILMVCFWPVLLPLVTVASIVWVVMDRKRLIEVLVIAGGAWLVMIPWLPTLFSSPGRMLTGVDPLAWQATWPAGPATLVGRILVSGFPTWLNIVVFVGIGLAALVAMVRIESRRIRLCLLAGISVPLLIGTVLSRIVVTVPDGQARPLLSGWALLVIAVLLTAVVLARSAPTNRGFRISLVILGLLGVCAVGTWGWIGFSGPVQRATTTLPSYVTSVMESPRASRVLLLERGTGSQLAWNLVDASQPRWGSAERAPAGPRGAEYAVLVQSLSGGAPAEDLTQQLSDLAISHIYMRGFSEDRLSALDNVAGLTRATAGENAVIWRVAGEISRTQLIDGRSQTPITDGSIEASRRLRAVRLAAAPDPRWELSVGGTPLKLIPDRAPVTFELPANTAGQVSYRVAPATRSVVWQIIVLAALGLLATPTLASWEPQARRGIPG